MTNLLAAFLIAVGLAWPQFATAGPNEEAAALRAQWEQAYNVGDADRLVGLYTREATLFGSSAQLFSGTAGVRAYFSKLPPGIRTTMGDQQAVAVGPDVLLSSGFATFTLKDGTAIPYRFTLAFVKVDGQWLIAQHHGSPVPK